MSGIKTEQQNHVLVTIIPELSEEQKTRISTCTEASGYTAYFFDTAQEAAAKIEQAEILFSSNASLQNKAPKLKWQCTTSAGVNQFIGSEKVRSGEVILTNSSGAYGVTIAEHIIMVSLEILRRQAEYTEIIQKRSWTRNLPVRSLLGRKITLLGTGNLGQEAAVRLRAFQPHSITGINRSGINPNHIFDRIVTIDHLETALPETELLICALPGTPDTEGVLNKEMLSLLPEQAVIVNVGRGSLIDQQALESELRAGRLQAALDVFETEPIPSDSTLWDCPNLLITPHCSGDTSLPWTVELIVRLFLEDFERYVKQEPLMRRVDLAKGY